MEKSIGALWTKQGNKGEYLSGNIEVELNIEQETKKIKVPIIAFQNTYKKDKQPDYRIYAQKQKEAKQEDIFAPNDSELPF